jgi:hypothetical protein
MYLLDTNVVINFLDASLPKSGMQFISGIVDDKPCVSVITKIEALGFNFQSANEQNTIEAFISGSNVLNIDNEIVSKTIEIRKSIKIALPDAIIAATVLVYNFTLLTRNMKDFRSLPELKLKNPWES